MTFQHDLLPGPCAYPGHINTVPTCTISLKLVPVFAFMQSHIHSTLGSSPSGHRRLYETIAVVTVTYTQLLSSIPARCLLEHMIRLHTSLVAFRLIHA